MKFLKRSRSAYLLKIQMQMAIEEHAKLSTTIMYMCYNGLSVAWHHTNISLKMYSAFVLILMWLSQSFS